MNRENQYIFLYKSLINPYIIEEGNFPIRLVIKLSKVLPKPFNSLFNEFIIYPDIVGKKAETKKKNPNK